MKMKKHRHPKEQAAMFFTFGAATIASLVFATATLGCGLFLMGLAFTWGYFRFYGRSNLERYAAVDAQNHPRLYHLVDQARREWGLGPLDVYLNPTSQINAAASDFGKHFLIVNQGLWETINDETQRKFVIGHELGHIGLGHSWLSVLAYQADNAFERSLFGIVFRFFLLGYARMKELSADRIGLLTCGSLEASLEALAILSMGKHHPGDGEVRRAVNHLISNKASADQNWAELFSSHPDMYERAQELVRYAKEVGLG